MAPLKQEGRKSFVSMNWPGKASPHTRIRARLSQTRRRATTAWTLARGHSFPAMARNSARPVSKPGSLSPRRKRRAPTSGSVKARPVCVNRPHSNERFAYDDYKADFGARMPGVPPSGHQRGEGDAAHVETPDGVSWQGRCHAHHRVSAGEYGPHPSTQCTRVYLCAGRLDRDAGEGREGSDSDTRSDLL